MNKIVKDETFNPNEGDGTPGGLMTLDRIQNIEQYADFWTNIGGSTPFQQWCNTQAAELGNDISKSAVQKAVSLPPEMQSFTRFTLMPGAYAEGGVIQWPGIPPEALRKVARENLAPQTIIGQRVDDVLNYSKYSTHPWKPGWRIAMRKGLGDINDKINADIEDAQRFIEHCVYDKMPVRERDAKQYKDFPTFLGELIRDSLTFDGMAVWTDMSLGGQVKAYKCLSSFNIRLCLPEGYKHDPKIFAVGVDEANNVIHSFTRDQLTFRHRNSRPDSDIYGYGFPEIEQAIRLIQAITNSIDMNADVFNRNSVPNGFLVIKGQMNQRQLDVLSRIWINLKRGTTKSWAMPVIPIPKDGDIEIKDLSRLKEHDTYFPDFQNMIWGLFCAIYRFPVKRLGFFASGKTKDNSPETPATASATVEDYDPFLPVLLGHAENLINPYLIGTRWPHLDFGFTGKSPKEDARLYEARILSSTVDERRALQDMPAMETLSSEPKEKMVMSLMGKCPVDPALIGAYQTAITTAYAPEPEAGEGEPGSRMTSKKDPARAADHGHASGVRRDSAAESKKS
jgi:hypothetical protein